MVLDHDNTTRLNKSNTFPKTMRMEQIPDMAGAQQKQTNRPKGGPLPMPPPSASGRICLQLFPTYVRLTQVQTCLWTSFGPCFCMTTLRRIRHDMLIFFGSVIPCSEFHHLFSGSDR